MGFKQIVLDTETSGQDSKTNRIIEIGAVELIDRVPTGRKFHYYLNPEGCPIEDGAFKVHGISADFLKDKPIFRSVVDEFISFIRGAELLIHNADFDIGFLNSELDRIGKPRIWEYATVQCTLKIAQSIFPGKRNNLNALSERLGVDVSHRDLHGALLDAEILKDAYLLMTENAAPFIDDEVLAKKQRDPVQIYNKPRVPVVVNVSENEKLLHNELVSKLEDEFKVSSMWNNKERSSFKM